MKDEQFEAIMGEFNNIKGELSILKNNQVAIITEISSTRRENEEKIENLFDTNEQTTSDIEALYALSNLNKIEHKKYNRLLKLDSIS